MKFLKAIFFIGRNNNLLDLWMLILRLLIGGFMLTHGFVKFQTLISGEEIAFYDPIGLGVKFAFMLVVFAEFFCSILIILGLFTRLATIPLMIAMCVASFVAHGGDLFAKKELSLLYLILYINILVIGAGKYSLDNLIHFKFLKNR